MGWVDSRADQAALVVRAREIDKSISIKTEDWWAWKVIAAIGAVFFGYQSLLRRPMALACWVKIPSQLTLQGALLLLAHEGRHVRQMRWLGLMIHPLVGALPFYFIYFGLGAPLFGVLLLLGIEWWAIVWLCLSVPIGLCYPRAWFELDADRERWREMVRAGYRAVIIRTMALRFAEAVGGRQYLYPWVRVRAMFDGALTRVLCSGN